MAAKEIIKDTIVVAWPPQDEANEDKASGPNTTQNSISVATTNNSTAPRRRLPAKKASAKACGFCRPFLRPDESCSHVGNPHKSIRCKGSVAVALVEMPANGRGSK